MEQISQVKGEATELAGNINLAPSWDLFIFLFFAVCVGYSLLLGKAKISGIMLSTYVALAIANESGNFLYNYFNKSSYGASTSIFTFKTVLFGLIILFFTLKNENIKMGEVTRGLMGTIMSVVYGFFSAGLILTSVASFMSDIQRAAIYKQSNLAAHMMQFRFIWLIIPNAFIVFFSTFKS